MDYNRYGQVVPTLAGGGSRHPSSSLPSNFMVESLRQGAALPHLPISSTPAAIPPFRALSENHLEPLGIHILGTHLGTRAITALSHLPRSSSTPATNPPFRALPQNHHEPLGIHLAGAHLGPRAIQLSPYDASLPFPHVVPRSSSRANDFRDPMKRSIREPYREPIGVPLWNYMNVTEPRNPQNAVRRQLIQRDLGWKPVLRGQDGLSSHVPFDHRRRSRPDKTIARNDDAQASSIARMEAQLQRITQALKRDGRLNSPRDSDIMDRSSSSNSPSDSGLMERSSSSSLDDDDDNNNATANPEPNENLYVCREEEHGLNKQTDPGLHTNFESSERDILPKENHEAPKIPERPGWCSLCNLDCITKEVLHKSHTFGKKHKSMLRKVKETPGDEKKSPDLMGWCSLCEVDCKTMEALHGEHILSEKHQLMLGIQRKPQIKRDEEVQEMDNSIGKRKQQIEEEGSISLQKRQKLSVLNIECKICNKEFTSQVVLESHLSGKKHGAQPKKLTSSEAPIEVNQNKKSAGVDGQDSENSKLVVLAKDDAKAGGQ